MWPVVAGVASNLGSFCEPQIAIFDCEGPVGSDRRQHGPPIVEAVAGPGKGRDRRDDVMVPRDPALPDGMHAVRSAGDR